MRIRVLLAIDSGALTIPLMPPMTPWAVFSYGLRPGSEKEIMFSTVLGKLVISEAEVMHTDQKSKQVNNTIITEPINTPASASKG